MNFIKRLFCKHDYRIVRLRFGFFVCSDVMRCKYCNKERRVNKEDLQKQLTNPKPIKEDRSKMCKRCDNMGYSYPFKDKSIGLHDGVHRPRRRGKEIMINKGNRKK